MNIGALLKDVQDRRVRKDVPEFRVGDSIRINIKIKEGDKVRVQPFEGVVIARRGSGLSSKFCVRRISYNVGVEKTFPLHSPIWESIRVLRPALVKRAKLRYFFQDPNRDMRFKEDASRVASAAIPAEARKESAPKAADPAAEKKTISAEKMAKQKERRAKKKDKRESRRELAVSRATKAPQAEPVAAAAGAEKAEEKKA